MSTVKIICYENNFFFSQLKEASISVNDKDNRRVLLKRITGNSTIEYEIREGSFELTFDEMREFLLKKIENVIINNKTLFISEDPIRQYIYIGDDENNMKQFEAKKLTA